MTSSAVSSISSGPLIDAPGHVRRLVSRSRGAHRDAHERDQKPAASRLGGARAFVGRRDELDRLQWDESLEPGLRGLEREGIETDGHARRVTSLGGLKSTSDGRSPAAGTALTSRPSQSDRCGSVPFRASSGAHFCAPGVHLEHNLPPIGPQKWLSTWALSVGTAGLEPVASTVSRWRSNQLSYVPGAAERYQPGLGRAPRPFSWTWWRKPLCDVARHV